MNLSCLILAHILIEHIFHISFKCILNVQNPYINIANYKYDIYLFVIQEKDLK